MIKSYLAKDKSSNKVKDSVCLALAKLISVVVLNNSTMASLDLLLNNSQVKSILTNHGMDFELENLSVIHPIKLENIDNKYPLNLFKIKNNYIKSYLNCESDVSKIMLDNKDLAGIYYWYNNINGKAYVGSAENLSKRLALWTRSSARTGSTPNSEASCLTLSESAPSRNFHIFSTAIAYKDMDFFSFSAGLIIIYCKFVRFCGITNSGILTKNDIRL